MTYRVRVSARAARDIRKAADWWAENRSRAPLAFAEDIESAFQLLAALPGSGEAVAHSRLSNLRRLLLTRIRYHLYYVVDEAESAVDLLTVWHTSRGQAPNL